MNVVLPKTLAEPWTIPWFTPFDNELPEHIIETLHQYIRGAVALNQLPTDDWDAWGKTQYSLAELIDCLQIIAIKAGALTAKAREISCKRDGFLGKRLGKHAWAISGFSYHIEFTVPHDPRTHDTIIDHWFLPKHRIVYGAA